MKERNLTVEIINPKKQVFNLNYNLSSHALTRLSQRGISLKEVKLCLTYGKCIYKQGLCFYTLQKNLIPDMIKARLKISKDLVLVADEDSAQIITIYRSRKGFLHIRKKINQLKKAA